MTSSTDVAQLAAEIVARLKEVPVHNTPSLRALRREYSRRLAKAPATIVLQLGMFVVEHPGIEHRFLAYELLCHHREAMRRLRAKELDQLGRGLASWAAVDMFACYLAGPAWREHQVPDSWIYRWARSPDRWRRRAAVVSSRTQHRPVAGTVTPLVRLRFAGFAGRPDDMVVKALSALREPRDPLVRFCRTAEVGACVAR